MQKDLYLYNMCYFKNKDKQLIQFFKYTSMFISALYNAANNPGILPVHCPILQKRPVIQRQYSVHFRSKVIFFKYVNVLYAKNEHKFTVHNTGKKMQCKIFG